MVELPPGHRDRPAGGRGGRRPGRGLGAATPRPAPGDPDFPSRPAAGGPGGRAVACPPRNVTCVLGGGSVATLRQVRRALKAAGLTAFEASEADWIDEAVWLGDTTLVGDRVHGVSAPGSTGVSASGMEFMVNLAREDRTRRTAWPPAGARGCPRRRWVSSSASAARGLDGRALARGRIQVVACFAGVRA